MADAPSGTAPYVLAVTGASGAVYALRTALALLRSGKPLQIVVSENGRYVMAGELGIGADGDFAQLLARRLSRPLQSAGIEQFDPEQMSAPPASGSAPSAGMVIVPCSMKTLSAVATGASRNLIERAADVALKERRPLVLVVRESPLSLIHLRNMCAAAEAGATIVPAAPAFYFKPESFDDLADFIAGRVLSALGIEHSLFPSWRGGPPDRQ